MNVKMLREFYELCESNTQIIINNNGKKEADIVFSFEEILKIFRQNNMWSTFLEPNYDRESLIEFMMWNLHLKNMNVDELRRICETTVEKYIQDQINEL